MNKSFISNTVLAALVAMSTWALWSVGEHRIDAYIAMYTLEYVVVKAIFRPRRRGIDLLLVVLLTVFFVIVSIRVYWVITRP